MLRRTLGNQAFIHVLVLLGMVALWGYAALGNPYLLLGVAASFLGAICGAFIRVTDELRKNKE